MEPGGEMSERKHEQKVKDVSVDDECLYIELLNGLRLTGPLRTNPVYRDPVHTEEPAPAQAYLPAMSV
jgi:hypothetical protein